MTTKMPVLFVGHGSPMVALEDSNITRAWKKIAENIPQPKAILAISAHWYGDDNRIQSDQKPKQIYDMYGFPMELYEIKYEPKGDLPLTKRVQELLGSSLTIDDDWGIDHGTWSVLVHMYPKVDIPVVQLSINMKASGKQLFEIGERLMPLRDEGVLLFGTGNIVHNLRKAKWGMEDGTPEANEFDQWVKERILERDVDAIMNYKAHPLAPYAAPTPDHFIPLLYILGATSAGDEITVFNEVRQLGSISMTGYLWGPSA